MAADEGLEVADIGNQSSPPAHLVRRHFTFPESDANAGLQILEVQTGDVEGHRSL